MIESPTTDWFPAIVDPVHAGWYECRYCDADLPQLFWFDGALWRLSPNGPSTYFGNSADETDIESWRGLAVDVAALA